MAKDFTSEMRSLTALFEQVVPRKWIQNLAKILLRRVYSNEETEELRGMSEATGVGMHLLVSFNVLLDLFMGCTSSAVRVAEDEFGPSRMLHLRTLDWGMEPLRSVIVQVQYVYGVDSDVLASSITYVGFVGVLTGVRKGLSMSLNFRPVHDDASWLANFKFYGHHCLILLGFCPSISSLLRRQLLGSRESRMRSDPSALGSLDDCRAALLQERTTAAYVILSDGQEGTVIEKDRKVAQTRSSRDFVVATNHDEQKQAADHRSPDDDGSSPVKEDLFEEFSVTRSDCVEEKVSEIQEKGQMVKTREALTWLIDWPTTNSLTHFAVLMDPLVGKMLWCRRWLRWPRGPHGEVVEGDFAAETTTWG
ncbi:MAG: hypothetical protein M1828_007082 [Chrysothrix sp. TS-e1954]|nr:MAG: hypothetical protein M1828_007082 [Chrysothrix sp. TS-e1954]